MNLTFWKNKRVFVTGHTGFKGSWLCLWLQTLGAHVTGYALSPPTTPSLFVSGQVADGMTSVIGDIRDLAFLTQTMQQAVPEIVIHMAAQPLVRYSYQHPVETYGVNVMGTVNLCEAIRQTPSVKAVVNVTTDKCYENKEWEWGYRENEPLGGYDPYSSSKACSELVSAAYRQSFFQESGSPSIATARAGNVIGGGDWAQDRLIPDSVRAFTASETLSVRFPHATRPWQHVLEPLRGYLMLAEALYVQGAPYAGAWNFGPYEQDVKPVSWIVDQMTALWGSGATWQRIGEARLHEAHSLKLDISKASSQLGWRPILSLGEALSWIVRWHQENQQGQSARVRTINDILDYQKRITHV